jgi:hypothetical protein
MDNAFSGDGAPEAEVLRNALPGKLVGNRRRRYAPKEAAMLVNLHLWEAPVRNLDWVTSAFGYR